MKGVVALEPTGPPFRDEILMTGTDRPWGLTNVALTYDPPAGDPLALRFERQAAADGPGLVRCRRQAEPARRLPNLRGIPILILTSEASFHAAYDHCTAKYLAQAGVENDFVRLPDRGIRGNGHMMMLEKNSSEIASLVVDWLRGRVAEDR